MINELCGSNKMTTHLKNPFGNNSGHFLTQSDLHPQTAFLKVMPTTQSNRRQHMYIVVRTGAVNNDETMQWSAAHSRTGPTTMRDLPPTTLFCIKVCEKGAVTF